MKRYRGTPPITPTGESEKVGPALVEVVGAEMATGDLGRYVLPPRNDLWNHSPDGFQWGYGGSRPAQLALAILADCFMNDNLAVRAHQSFKWKVIARLPQGEPWELTEEQVRMFVDQPEGGVSDGC